MEQHRRSFLVSACKAGLVLAAGSKLACHRTDAAEAIERRVPSRVRLGLAAYSFRDFFEASTPAAGSRRIDLFEFIDYCSEQGCDGAELTSYYFPRDVADEYLARVRRHAFLSGVDVSGTAVGNTFTLPAGERRDREIASVKKWIDRAQLLGAPHIRIFAGEVPPGVSPAQARSLCIGAIEECCDYAGGRGVMLGLENHGGIVAESGALLGIIRDVRSQWLGINLDTGNFRTEDPYQDLEKCAPYAVNVQLKSEIVRKGQKRKEPADLTRLAGILKAVKYSGYVVLEYEAEQDPWTAVPLLLKQIHEVFA